jgi:hypothetical protein
MSRKERFIKASAKPHYFPPLRFASQSQTDAWIGL